jgi:hypothetical protein
MKSILDETKNAKALLECSLSIRQSANKSRHKKRAENLKKVVEEMFELVEPYCNFGNIVKPFERQISVLTWRHQFKEEMCQKSEASDRLH